MSLSKKIQQITLRSPSEEGTIGYYPSFLIDPCIIPLQEFNESKIEAYGRYQNVILTSSSRLPYGHYARLIIAHLTTQIIRYPERPSYVIAHSVSDLFKQVTGQEKISGGTYNNFLTSFERVFDTTFTLIPTEKSKEKIRRRGFFAEADNLINDKHSVGQYNKKYKKLLFIPSGSFKSLISNDKKIILVDLRFLQLAREKNVVFIHDLYIYLIHRCYKRKKTVFIPWETLHKDVFQYLDDLTPSRFKIRFIRALDFILTCHPNITVNIDDNHNGIHISPHSNLLREKWTK